MTDTYKTPKDWAKVSEMLNDDPVFNDDSAEKVKLAKRGNNMEAKIIELIEKWEKELAWANESAKNAVNNIAGHYMAMAETYEMVLDDLYEAIGEERP